MYADDPNVIQTLSNKYMMNSNHQDDQYYKWLTHRNDRNESALHWAIEWSSLNALNTLLSLINASCQHDCNPKLCLYDAVNNIDINGDTPLHRIGIDCDTNRRTQQMIATLLRYDADPHIQNHYHRTPLQHCTFKTITEPTSSIHNDHSDHGITLSDLDAATLNAYLDQQVLQFKQNLTEEFNTV